MDPIKEAFLKAKQDIQFLNEKIDKLTQELEELKRTLNTSYQSVQPTNQQMIPTHQHSLEHLKSSKTSFSTGNEGVPTNQPTIQPTNQRTGNEGVPDKISHLERVSEILGSLDALKKEVRIKFKKLTQQEMVIYGAIYQLQEQGNIVDYTLLASKLKLSEISIRDYIRKIAAKGIPLNKEKVDNKKIRLTIPEDLRRVATLETILALREL